MKDTISDRSAYSVAYAESCGILLAQENEKDAADSEGRALGHAFRAAELAYDLGYAHAKSRILRFPMMLKIGEAPVITAVLRVTG
jgi:hypothetical protein